MTETTMTYDRHIPLTLDESDTLSHAVCKLEFITSLVGMHGDFAITNQRAADGLYYILRDTVNVLETLEGRECSLEL